MVRVSVAIYTYCLVITVDRVKHDTADTADRFHLHGFCFRKHHTIKAQILYIYMYSTLSQLTVHCVSQSQILYIYMYSTLSQLTVHCVSQSQILYIYMYMYSTLSQLTVHCVSQSLYLYNIKYIYIHAGYA